MPATKSRHVLDVLVEIGHDNLAGATRRYQMELAEHGYAVDNTLTVKEDTIKLAIRIAPLDPEQMEMPLFEDGESTR